MKIASLKGSLGAGWIIILHVSFLPQTFKGESKHFIIFLEKSSEKVKLDDAYICL